MRPPARLLAYLSVLGILGIAAGSPGLFGLNESARKGPGLSSVLSKLQAEVKRAEALDVQLARSRRRLAHRDEIARAAASGRLTLREAAARFRELSERMPGFDPVVFQMTTPGGSDEERYCRAVIIHVRRVLPDGPAEAAARLEAELREHLECEGKITLPRVDPEERLSPDGWATAEF
jgi:hypothetical protein